ncbi:MAG: class I adenylate-forming enzyme family protein [Myxococcota bacterium]
MSWSPLEILRQWRERPFLIAHDRVWNFDAVAQVVAETARDFDEEAGPLFIRPERTVGGIIQILGAIESKHRPFVLHPRLSPDERRVIRERFSGVRRAGDEVCFTTSGTTGSPKAVRLGLDALQAAAEASAANLGWQAHDRWLLSIPPAHIGGFSIVVRCLLAGRTVVLPDAMEERFHPDAFAHDVDRYGVTICSIVPTMLHRLATSSTWPVRNTLRAVLCGGARTPSDLVEASAARGWPLLVTYGLTEAAAQVATQPYGTSPHPHWGAGRPLEGVDVQIRRGRIFVRGPNLMRGYEGELPGFDASGFFDTGDHGEMKEGLLHVFGRGDDVIISGGENVFPAEVEEVLRRHPAVREACVLGVPDPEWGEAVAAAVVGDRSDLAGFVRERLASFKTPKHWIWVDALPTTDSGKVSRSELRRALLSERGHPGSDSR